MSFADLKKNQGMSGAKHLQEALEKLNSKEGRTDTDNYWKLTMDKSGVGAAVIRFLPKSEGDQLPWVLFYEHSFKGPSGLWYIEKSRTTLGGAADPVSEYNSQLWNSGIESNKGLARSQKRNARYVSNILVIKDPKNPDNEGKVFLFKYGKKIFEKVKEAMMPEQSDLEQKDAINPFCPWTGANFMLKSRMVDGFLSYEQSYFSKSEPLFNGDDKKIEELWKQQHKLAQLVDPSQFKSYDELKKRLDRVLGQNSSVAASGGSTRETAKVSLEAATRDVANDSSSEDISDDLSYLQQLANQE